MAPPEGCLTIAHHEFALAPQSKDCAALRGGGVRARSHGRRLAEPGCTPAGALPNMRRSASGGAISRSRGAGKVRGSCQAAKPCPTLPTAETLRAPLPTEARPAQTRPRAPRPSMARPTASRSVPHLAAEPVAPTEPVAPAAAQESNVGAKEVDDMFAGLLEGAIGAVEASCLLEANCFDGHIIDKDQDAEPVVGALFAGIPARAVSGAAGLAVEDNVEVVDMRDVGEKGTQNQMESMVAGLFKDAMVGAQELSNEDDIEVFDDEEVAEQETRHMQELCARSAPAANFEQADNVEELRQKAKNLFMQKYKDEAVNLEDVRLKVKDALVQKYREAVQRSDDVANVEELRLKAKGYLMRKYADPSLSINAREATNDDELRQKARGLFTRWSRSLPEEEASTTEHDENELRMKARDALEKALDMPAEPQELVAKEYSRGRVNTLGLFKATNTDELRQKARGLFTRLAHSMPDVAEPSFSTQSDEGAGVDTADIETLRRRARNILMRKFLPTEVYEEQASTAEASSDEQLSSASEPAEQDSHDVEVLRLQAKNLFMKKFSVDSLRLKASDNLDFAAMGLDAKHIVDGVLALSTEHHVSVLDDEDTECAELKGSITIAALRERVAEEDVEVFDDADKAVARGPTPATQKDADDVKGYFMDALAKEEVRTEFAAQAEQTNDILAGLLSQAVTSMWSTRSESNMLVHEVDEDFHEEDLSLGDSEGEQEKAQMSDPVEQLRLKARETLTQWARKLPAAQEEKVQRSDLDDVETLRLQARETLTQWARKLPAAQEEKVQRSDLDDVATLRLQAKGLFMQKYSDEAVSVPSDKTQEAEKVDDLRLQARETLTRWAQNLELAQEDEEEVLDVPLEEASEDVMDEEQLRLKARNLFTRWSLSQEEAEPTEQEVHELRMKARHALEKALDMPVEPQEELVMDDTDMEELRLKARGMFARWSLSLPEEAGEKEPVAKEYSRGRVNTLGLFKARDALEKALDMPAEPQEQTEESLEVLRLEARDALLTWARSQPAEAEVCAHAESEEESEVEDIEELRLQARDTLLKWARSQEAECLAEPEADVEESEAEDFEAVRLEAKETLIRWANRQPSSDEEAERFEKAEADPCTDKLRKMITLAMEQAPEDSQDEEEAAGELSPMEVDELRQQDAELLRLQARESLVRWAHNQPRDSQEASRFAAAEACMKDGIPAEQEEEEEDMPIEELRLQARETLVRWARQQHEESEVCVKAEGQVEQEQEEEEEMSIDQIRIEARETLVRWARRQEAESKVEQEECEEEEEDMSIEELKRQARDTLVRWARQQEQEDEAEKEKEEDLRCAVRQALEKALGGDGKSEQLRVIKEALRVKAAEIDAQEEEAEQEHQVDSVEALRVKARDTFLRAARVQAELEWQATDLAEDEEPTQDDDTEEVDAEMWSAFTRDMSSQRAMFGEAFQEMLASEGADLAEEEQAELVLEASGAAKEAPSSDVDRLAEEISAAAAFSAPAPFVLKERTPTVHEAAPADPTAGAAETAAPAPLVFGRSRKVRKVEEPLEADIAMGSAAREASPASVAGRLRPQQKQNVIAFRIDDGDEPEEAAPQLCRKPSITNLYETLGPAMHVLDDDAVPSTPTASPPQRKATSQLIRSSSLSALSSPQSAAPSPKRRNKRSAPVEHNFALSQGAMPSWRSPMSPACGSPLSAGVCAGRLTSRRALQRSASAAGF